MDWVLVNEIFQWVVLVALMYMGVDQGFKVYDMKDELDELTFRQEGKQRDEQEVQCGQPQARKDPVKLEVADGSGGKGGNTTVTN